MADTIRSRADLIALLPDNTAGDISPQDVRDVLVSVHGVYGCIYVHDNSGGTAQTIGTSFTKVTQFASSGVSAGTTLDTATTNDITPGTAGVYEVSLAISFSGTGNTTFTVAAYKNAARENQCSLERKIGSGGDVGSASFRAPMSLAASDAVSVYVKADGAGKSFLVHQAALSIKRIA